MEQVIKLLEQATAALKEWREADHRKDFRIAELEAQVKAAAQAALPQVSVTGVPVFNTEKNTLDVRWEVSTDSDTPLPVNVTHTDTSTGKETDYVWNVAGKTGAVYSYPVGSIPNGATFKIREGEGYTVTGEPVTIRVPKPVAVPSVEARVLQQREPFRITQGGVYENLHIKSAISRVPCIELRTEQPVTLGGCEFEGAGYIIENHSGKTNLKVIDCKAKGLPHDGTMSDPRRFLSVNNIINLEVTNCQTEHMGFLTSQGAFHGSGNQGIRVLHNHVKNISGLRKSGRVHTNFVQLMHSGANGIPNVQIAYNGVYNAYGQSDVEDNINLFNARGRKDSRMQIRDNLIYGAYYHPTQETGKYYSGGGIITDGDGVADIAPGFIDVYRNYVIATANYCIAIAAGSDIRFFENVCVVASVLPDGRRYHEIVAPNHLGVRSGMFTSGIQSNDYYKSARTERNEFRNNTLGVRYYDRRNDIRDVTAGAAIIGTRHLPDPITTGTEQLYVQEWEMKYKDKLGVRL